jgi:hypothetical protein
MAIAFTCSECEKDLKVKDEFAGRKVKCPKCGGSTTVPAAKKAKKKIEEDDEVEEKEERPKKKKKKWNRNNSEMVRIIAAIGLLLAGVAAIVVVLIVKLSGGEEEPKEKKKPAEIAKVPDQKPPEDPYKKDPRVGLRRIMDRVEARSILRGLGQAYAAHETLHKKGPADRDELSRSVNNDFRTMEYIDKNWFTFIYGADRKLMTAGSSNTILAYETYKDGTNQRLVLMADGSVTDMDEPTFAGAAKAK